VEGSVSGRAGYWLDALTVVRWLALLDFQKTEEYVKMLQSLGWKDAQRSGSRHGMFPPVGVVTGTRPM